MGLRLPVRDHHQPAVSAGSRGPALHEPEGLQDGAHVSRVLGCRHTGGQRASGPYPGGMIAGVVNMVLLTSSSLLFIMMMRRRTRKTVVMVFLVSMAVGILAGSGLLILIP